ncbi:hypothetical protein P3X46_016608 [Hevea brasiliensis]|uniref:ADP-ribosyl cyclase/cyclic ADP-ribose hydrolase n=2 Tax=Hevea brasiliensis TaxID=3981 RepID=A0ABQ9M3K0_HEVBR|nr:hypothetical protein P3X46_016608 [Hevea brasiliensis]
MDSSIEEIKAFLSSELVDVLILGIWGMGGIGKTTLAEAVFNQIACQFEGCCFLANVREKSEKSGGLTCLQEELLSKTLEEKDLKVDTPNIGYSFLINRMLSSKKVLIVVDDASSSDQVELLVGNRQWFGPGSRIIITSRDKQVLRKSVDHMYEVKKLEHHEALQLFSQNAFKMQNPTEDYQALSYSVIEYAKGIPLAVKVLGSFLFAKSKSEWDSALCKLKKAPHKDIKNVLKISYDELDGEEKDIFLHIACFFSGESLGMVTQILDGCGFSTEIGLRVLIDKSLISIPNNTIAMHDLLQEMGKEIVRQEFKEPGRRSRLWNHEEILHVLKKKTGTEAIEGMFLDMSKISKMHLSSNAFERMHNLQFLKFYKSDCCRDFGEESKVRLSQGLESLPDELRYLYWHGYPLESLPANFHLMNLIVLSLPHGKVRTLWKGNKDPTKLREIDLSFSQGLIDIPDLSRASNLTCMKLSGCNNIKSLPSTIGLRSLRTLDVNNCSKLKIFPEISRNIRFLYLNGTAIKEVPSSIAYLIRLQILEMNFCTELEILPSSICKLKSLEILSLHGCLNLKNFPEISEVMDQLKVLILNATGIKELPSSIEHLKGLSSIYLENCKNLTYLPESFCNLKALYWLFLASCPQLEKLPKKLSNLTILEDLTAGGCNLLKLPSHLNHLSCISKLDLSGNSFEKLPASIKKLPHLQWLNISSCKRLQSVMELPLSLTDLDAHDCGSLEDISGLKQLFQLKCVEKFYQKRFVFTCCFKVEENVWSDFLADAQLWIQKVSMRVNDEESFSIWYPGSKIPEWFTNQSEGSSIMIQLPPHSRKYVLLGFVLCVVLAFQANFEYHNSFFHVLCVYHFKNNCGDCSDLQELYSSRSHVSGNAKNIWSEHVLLFFDPNFSAERASEFRYDEASFEFHLQNNDSNGRQSCKIKNCAVFPLYDQEEKYSNMEEETCKRKRSWDGSGREDYPKRMMMQDHFRKKFRK